VSDLVRRRAPFFQFPLDGFIAGTRRYDDASAWCPHGDVIARGQVNDASRASKSTPVRAIPWLVNWAGDRDSESPLHQSCGDGSRCKRGHNSDTFRVLFPTFPGNFARRPRMAIAFWCRRLPNASAGCTGEIGDFAGALEYDQQGLQSLRRVMCSEAGTNSRST